MSMSLYAVRTSAGINVKTATMLIATPFASASPRSKPILNCIRHSARKPMTVVSPLERIDDEDIVSARTIASFWSGSVCLHSAKRCRRNTE